MKGRASLPGADELFRVTSIEKGRDRGAKQPAEEAQQDDRETTRSRPSASRAVASGTTRRSPSTAPPTS
jgi:hypothetical protein